MSDFWQVASTNLRACRSWRPFFKLSEIVLAACVAPRSSSSGDVFSACWNTNFSTCGATRVLTTVRSILAQCKPRGDVLQHPNSRRTG